MKDNSKTKRELVFEIVSSVSGVPKERLHENMDVVDDLDWKFDDEGLSILLRRFIKKLEIYIPKHDFSKYLENKRLAILLYPVYYIKFLYIDREPIVKDHLSIKEMIDIAERGVWDW